MSELKEAAEGYLKSAPRGPYRDLVSQLVIGLSVAEGSLQDLRSDLKAYPIQLMIRENGSFIVATEDERWLEVFERVFLSGGS
jgi:hypothetical protein